MEDLKSICINLCGIITQTFELIVKVQNSQPRWSMRIQSNSRRNRCAVIERCFFVEFSDRLCVPYYRLWRIILLQSLCAEATPIFTVLSQRKKLSLSFQIPKFVADKIGNFYFYFYFYYFYSVSKIPWC